jgi:hypothetical protein
LTVGGAGSLTGLGGGHTMKVAVAGGLTTLYGGQTMRVFLSLLYFLVDTRFF